MGLSGKKILIAGGSGHIGSALSRALWEEGAKIIWISRSKSRQAIDSDRALEIFTWEELEASPDQILESVYAVVNLAGTSIASQKWTAERKKSILESRTHATAALVRAIKQSKHTPEFFLQGSATGYYGNRKDSIITEASSAGEGFLAETALAWERKIKELKETDIKLAVSRTGIVLDKNKGMLAKLIPPFRYFMGGVPGNGQQYISWITTEDMVRALIFLIEERKEGIFNLVAPEPVTAKTFYCTLAKTLRRPCFLPQPGFLISLMFGQMGRELILEGQRALPKALINAGFTYKNSNIESAMQNILKH